MGVTYGSDELIDASEALLGLDASLQLPFISLLVPDLESFVELAHEVRSNFVIDHADKPALAVFRWVSYINTRLASLWIVGYTRRRHLYLFELDGEEFFETQALVVVVEDL